MTANDLSRCIPWDVRRIPGGAVVRWLRADGVKFSEPFAVETYARLHQQALRSAVVETPLEELLAVADQPAVLKPCGFIYHVSRCGSTLLANMLKTPPDHVVVAEPPLPASFLLELLAAPHLCPDAAAVGVVRASLAALSRCTEARRFFVKFVGANVLQVPLIRTAIPDVPEVFLYRDPVEVVVSNLQHPDQRWIWVPGATGLDRNAAVEVSMTELFARSVGRMLRAMHDHLGPHTLLMNYSEIDDSTPRRLVRFFDVDAGEDYERAMASRLEYRAKNSRQSERFAADTKAKQHAATPLVREMVARFATEPYEALERLRVSRAGAEICPSGSDSNQPAPAARVGS